MDNKNKNRTKANLIEVLIPAATSLFLLLFFTRLLETQKVGSATYLGLATLSFLVGFLIYFRNDIKEFDLKNMKVILEKTQRVKSEIDKIAFSTAKIIASLSAYSSGSWKNRKGLNDEIEKLLDTLNIDQSEKKKVLELPRIIEKGMKDNESLTKEERKKADEMFSLEENPQKNK